MVVSTVLNALRIGTLAAAVSSSVTTRLSNLPVTADTTEVLDIYHLHYPLFQDDLPLAPGAIRASTTHVRQRRVASSLGSESGLVYRP